MERENLFTCNLDDEDSIIDREEFILRKESEALAEKGKALMEQVLSSMDKGLKKKIFLAVLPFFLLLIGCLSVRYAVSGYQDTHALPLTPSLIALFSFFFAGVLFFVSKKKEKEEEAKEKASLNAFDGDFDAFQKERKKDLAVPEDATELEVFATAYSKDDPYKDGAYTNESVEIFGEGGKLCLLYGGVVIAIPVSEIHAFVKVDAPILFDTWMKDVSHDRGDFLQYNIQKTEIDDVEERYSMQGYYALRFTHEETPFEILIPLYEKIDALSSLIGMTPTCESV